YSHADAPDLPPSPTRRSSDLAAGRRRDAGAREHAPRPGGEPPSSRRGHARRGSERPDQGGGRPGPAGPPSSPGPLAARRKRARPDPESTRLNSPPRPISYAVF